MNKEEKIDFINNVIRQRRSSFPMEYNGEKIDDGIVFKLLENASWAPNHGRTEPWRFKVFKGPSLMALTEFQAGLYKENTPPELFSQSKYDRFFEKARRTSHLIAICMQKDPRGKIPEVEEVEAVACAVQNIYISLEPYGLRGYWSSGGGTYTEALHSYLKLTDTQQCLGFFYLGMSDQPLRDGKRGDINEKIEWL